MSTVLCVCAEKPVDYGLIFGLSFGLGGTIVTLIGVAILVVCIIRCVKREIVRSMLGNHSGVSIFTTGGGSTVNVRGTRYFVPWPVSYPHQLFFNVLGHSSTSELQTQVL